MCVMMMKITCFGVLAMISRTLAESGEVACCPPGQFLSLNKVPNKAVCFTLGNNGTTPASLDCEFGFHPFLYKSFVFENGKVSIVQENGSSHDNVTNIYCVNDMHHLQKNISVKLGIVCLDPAEVEINAYIMIVSVVFLVLAIIIYSVISELRDLYGHSFINLCGSLAIGFCLFSNISLMQEEYSDINISCAVKGFMTYFFLLVSFFWTTAISIQLLLSIRSSLPVVYRGWRTFAWYALFAWGCPAVMTICMAIYNFHPGNHVKPGIGLRTCWFNELHQNQQWYWMYCVMAVLISINIAIFGYITFFFCRNKFGSSHASTLKYKFGLVLRLFVVTGLYWIIELAAQFDQRTLVIWKILSGVICLQGLWIFLAWIVFRKRVIKAMHQRGWLACVSGLVEKHLENYDEVDDDIIVHTSVPMNER